MGRSQINWPLYNRSLVNRGKITFWFSKDTAKLWYNKQKSVRPGASYTYSHSAIEALSVVRFRFGLTLRETQGFAESLAELMKLDVEVPDYSTLCRRLEKVAVDLKAKASGNGPVHVVVDSTGLKVYGEGEWKVRIHGYSKRRTWRKLHLAVDESNNQILSVALSDNSFKDGEVFADLMDGVDADLERATGDGAYDDKSCYGWCEEHGAKGVFPPKRGAVIKQHGNSSNEPLARDEYVRDIRKHGRKGWKKKIGYHRRSLAETAMYRFKTILGDRLSSREFVRQAREAGIKCKILNMMRTPVYI
jgi:hypothetical protein